MLRTRKIIAVVSAALGVLLIVYGASGGLWPVSVQLVAGVLLVIFAVLRWRTLS